MDDFGQDIHRGAPTDPGIQTIDSNKVRQGFGFIPGGIDDLPENIEDFQGLEDIQPVPTYIELRKRIAERKKRKRDAEAVKKFFSKDKGIPKTTIGLEIEETEDEETTEETDIEDIDELIDEEKYEETFELYPHEPKPGTFVLFIWKFGSIEKFNLGFLYQRKLRKGEREFDYNYDTNLIHDVSISDQLWLVKGIDPAKHKLPSTKSNIKKIFDTPHEKIAKPLLIKEMYGLKEFITLPQHERDKFIDDKYWKYGGAAKKRVGSDDFMKNEKNINLLLHVQWNEGTGYTLSKTQSSKQSNKKRSSKYRNTIRKVNKKIRKSKHKQLTLEERQHRSAAIDFYRNKMGIENPTEEQIAKFPPQLKGG